MYTLQGKTSQHDIRTISWTLHTAIVHIDNQGVGPGPYLPSARLLRDTTLGDPWVAHTLSWFTSLQVWWDSIRLGDQQ
jgi:hypothetical protein